MRHSPALIPTLALILGLGACEGGGQAATAAPAQADAAANATAATATGAAAAAPALTQQQIAERAFAALRKTEPDFQRLGHTHLLGDLDGDGIDDVVIGYGEGTPDATMAANWRLAVAMSRPQGAQLLPQAGLPDYCAFARKIEHGKLYVEEPDICSAARPKTVGYYVYAWDGKGLAQVGHETVEQRVVKLLKPLGAAFASGDRGVVLDALRFPLDVTYWPIYDTPLEAVAKKTGGKIDRATAQAHYQDLFPKDRANLYAAAIAATVAKPLKRDSAGGHGVVTPAPDGEKYSLNIVFDPDEDREEGNGDRIIDARVDVAQSQGDGGQNLVLLLSEGKLDIVAINTAG
ncbi:hypothetical protein K4L06_18720 [Lysobacter sp. BMK333-48F3]|uniref:hypothetical protein n=1 Tax=Lysobacter sp. BMK333-48F3 TaxID=2867962 RepID=UPI001C8CD289|nr:hypothetical protein [Lysobacter sp. BMK333-48F3]MBX9403351.1 hypothetical protein [Lysobacter sp. BMK333-48F3]